METRYTAWHYFLAEVMQHMLDDRVVEVHPFEKLGTLPLEADIILLRKHADQDLEALHPELDVLLRHVGTYTVLEYKSPVDRLTHEDLDTVRAYALLCKRKFEIDADSEVRIVMLYSSVERGFFNKAKVDNGLDFKKIEAGVRRCAVGHQVLLTMNLVEVGKKRPGHLLNLFSSRHRVFVSKEKVDPRLLESIRYVYENLFKRRDMKHSEVRNLPELTQDMEEIRRRLLDGYSADELRERLSIEERLKGVPAEELRRRLSPDERLKGMSAEELRRHLSPEDRAKLRELLEQDDDC